MSIKSLLIILPIYTLIVVGSMSLFSAIITRSPGNSEWVCIGSSNDFSINRCADKKKGEACVIMRGNPPSTFLCKSVSGSKK